MHAGTRQGSYDLSVVGIENNKLWRHASGGKQAIALRIATRELEVPHTDG